MRRGTIIFLVFLALFLLVNVFAASRHLDFKHTPMKTLGMMIAAGLTLAMYSFLYKDNPVFKFTEHLYVGVATGYTVCLQCYQFLEPTLFSRLHLLLNPKFLLIIPAILGLLMFCRFVPKIAWLSRWSFAFIVGWGAGVSIPLVISQYILEQLRWTINPVNTDFSSFEMAMKAIGPVLVIIGVLTVLIYFYFSIEHKGGIGVLSRIGIWFLMISFGASFGFTVMGRVSLLIGRLDFLFRDWLNLLK